MTALTGADDTRPTGRRARIPLWLWVIAAVGAVAALIAAIVLYDSERPTLRAMAASESMTETPARRAADNTARVWMREHNASHLANVKALSCPETRDGVLGNELAHLKNHDPIRKMQVATTSGFTREGPTWKLNVITTEGGMVFVMRVRNGELRVCQIEAAPA